jgi:hypothetical protein
MGKADRTAQELALFRWPVCEDGYMWLKWRLFVTRDGEPARTLSHTCRPTRKAELVLTAHSSDGASYPIRYYNPLDTAPALFRLFADLPFDDRDAVRRFAESYGQIGLPRWGFDSKGTGVCETHEDWVAQVAAMRAAVQVWDARRSRDGSGLRELLSPIVVQGQVSWKYTAPKWELKALGKARREQLIDPPRGIKFGRGDATLPAFFLVQKWANEQLKEHSQTALIYDVAAGQPLLRMRPNTLLGAMWFQFAREVAGSTSYRQCPVCKKWFEVPLEENARKARQVFCSHPCKLRDYRRRQGQARRLWGEGRGVPEIAGATGTREATIRVWVKSFKKGGK